VSAGSGAGGPVLVAPGDFDDALPAAEVAAAIAAGLRDGGLGAEELPIADGLDAFDGRMRAARFVVTGQGRLDEQTMTTGGTIAEVARRCRQNGVGCHAVVGRSELEPFLVRILDLASVTEAGTPDELRATGRSLARRALGA
jgi:glycerate kinase